MSYDGFEVDMLSVGDGDAIVATQWTAGIATRVLIDGGNVDAVNTVRSFLLGRGITYLDHVICSHPHDDHAAGLLQLVNDRRFKFGRLWMHLPWNHVDTSVTMRAWRHGQAQRVVKILIASLENQVKLAKVAAERGIPMDKEPFTGERIGPLFVCGPSRGFYKALLMEFTDMEKLLAFESDLEKEARQDFIEDVFAEAGRSEPESGLLEEPHTECENNSSTIMWAKCSDETFVFTSDAGVPALERARTDYRIGGCYWMQVPHHGSRRNITQGLINYFSPSLAYVSAAGNRKHPRRAVVNAFKERHCQVFSTYYPRATHMWISRGTVPLRPGYRPLTRIYEAQT
jgi:beta-lactamase superfamily II metal-dependent hydrolase